MSAVREGPLTSTTPGDSATWGKLSADSTDGKISAARRMAMWTSGSREAVNGCPEHYTQNILTKKNLMLKQPVSYNLAL
jgi:hypothetical protein